MIQQYFELSFYTFLLKKHSLTNQRELHSLLEASKLFKQVLYKYQRFTSCFEKLSEKSELKASKSVRL